MNDTPHMSPSKEYFTRKWTEAVAALKQLVCRWRPRCSSLMTFGPWL
jgi:hypothetical protein